MEASRGRISGTPLDYLQNGRGEALNSNALLSSSWKYRDLFSPESAARRLLNLSDDVEKVRIERTSEEGNMTGLEISFAGTGEQARITMVQAYGDGGDHAGIWIPQDLQTNVVYRMMQADWEEVSRRTRGVDSYTGQTDIVCIGEIPDHNIRIYGYNDREITGKGVAVERGDRRDYYDWVYTSPQTILPDCYWNEEKEQLQIALRIYTGTGVSAQSLHVLQYGENSEPVDNEFDLGDYEDILQNRIGYTCDESTGILTITDRQYGETLAEVKVTEEMSEQAGGITGIEAGEISGFVLGDTVSLQIGLGCFSENYAIAWYENMPTVEAEVLMEQTGEGIRFDLGRLKVIEAAQ